MLTTSSSRHRSNIDCLNKENNWPGKFALISDWLVNFINGIVSFTSINRFIEVSGRSFLVYGKRFFIHYHTFHLRKYVVDKELKQKYLIFIYIEDCLIF